MTQHYNHGYSGKSYDNWVERNSNTSALGKVQKQFWFTKSAVMRKLGKREDEYIVASDAELDAKIELFRAIEESTRELQILLAEYQNKICILAQEENALGRLLKEYGKQDLTRAGKMMTAVGKSLSYTAQQRVALRNPLVRLFQEVDTFQLRAVEDTSHTVEEMEKIRTEYRGALMWMKNISKDFNPDHFQQLEKFREVQTIVKQKKSKFDQIKIKNLQKIELLAASRCNMFSHALILYQNNLITFSEKTAKTLNAVASNFKGYQPYKFHVIKELAEPEALVDDDEPEQNNLELGEDDRTFFCAEYHDDEKKNKDLSSSASHQSSKERNSDSLINLFNNEKSKPLVSIDSEPQARNHTDEVNSMTTSFADVDLLTNKVKPISEMNTNTEEMLKELFESTLHPLPSQTSSLFESTAVTIENSSNSDKEFDMFEKESFANTNMPSSSSKMFMPSHLLDWGLQRIESQPREKYEPWTSELVGLPLSPSPVGIQANPPSSNVLPPESRLSSSTTKEFQSGKSLPHPPKPKTKLDWYKVFQDIDPLADPGSAIFGKGMGDKKC